MVEAILSVQAQLRTTRTAPPTPCLAATRAIEASFDAKVCGLSIPPRELRVLAGTLGSLKAL